MCGRYQLGMDWESLLAHYQATRELLGSCTLPWFNEAPGQPAPAVFSGERGGRVVRVVRWGFPPMWVKRRGKDPWKERPLVNARAEDARKKATWRGPLGGQRCLVPTTGFYEWVRQGKARYPLHFAPAGGGLLTLAGIWEAFERPATEDRPAREEICISILTVGPNAEMAPVHDRMPVCLAAADWDAWLDPGTPDERIDALLRPAPDHSLAATPVSTALNGWRATGEAVLSPDWGMTPDGPRLL